jgi:Tol biopolymer transport system component
MRKIIGLIFVFAALANAQGQTKPPLPVIAYSSGNDVVLISWEGKPIKTIKLPIEVGEFAIAPDQKSLAVIPPHDGKHGAKMFLFTVATRKLVTIPSQTIDKEAGADEVYSEPQFSADGTKLLFATHAQADGDIVEGSGPLAILDLKTLRAKAIAATTRIGAGPDFLSHPRWDSAGRQVLMNIEDTLAVVDTQANSMRRLDHEVLENLLDWTAGVSWIGTNCIFYESGSAPTRAKSTFLILDLKTSKNYPAEKILGLSNDELRGVASFSLPYGVAKKNDGLALLTSGGKTESLSVPKVTTVQLIPPASGGDIPAECR